jgi:hypothetical protein
MEEHKGDDKAIDAWIRGLSEDETDAPLTAAASAGEP